MPTSHIKDAMLIWANKRAFCRFPPFPVALDCRFVDNASVVDTQFESILFSYYVDFKERCIKVSKLNPFRPISEPLNCSFCVEYLLVRPTLLVG